MTSNAFIKKQIRIFGLKFRYKVKLPYAVKFRNILAVNRPYVDEKIKNFQRRSAKIIPNMVLSMTSYPERMGDVHYAIFSILNQTMQPEKFILWLAQAEFPNGEKDVPQSILQFKKFGLEVRFTDAIRSFKKIIPALREFPNSILVSADDDIYYPADWLEKLYKSYLKDPTKIYCHRLHKVSLDFHAKKILPYEHWQKCIIDKTGSILNFPTSVGGILYPPNIFPQEATNMTSFLRLCPNQDDVWVWTMAVLKNKKCISPNDPINNDLIYVNPERELCLNGQSTLAQSNLNGENDQQIQNVSKFYDLFGRLNANY